MLVVSQKSISKTLPDVPNSYMIWYEDKYRKIAKIQNGRQWGNILQTNANMFKIAEQVFR